MPVLTTNSLQTANDALDFSADSQQWTIAAGVIAESENNDGVYSTFANSILQNKGTIVSDAEVGVLFNGPGALIYNESGASISGFTAISMDGTLPEVINNGSILGLSSNGITFAPDTTSARLHNGGYLFGHGNGIEVDSGTGATITNTGRIESDDNGIYVSTSSSATTAVQNSGSIQGDDHAIEVQSGMLSLTNSGTISGDITLAEGTNTIRNSGTITGDVIFASEADSFDGRLGTVFGTVQGGGGDDSLIGGSNDDAFTGGNGNDTLIGHAGDDILNGSNGADVLAGGSGQDVFIYAKASDSTVALRDTIRDFGHAQGDQIDLHGIDANTGVGGNQAFTFIGTAAFTNHAGELNYAVNGNGDAVVSGDVNGDGVADFQVVLHAVASLVAVDFVL